MNDGVEPAASGAAGAKGPLDGIRVLDLSRILAGPTMTQTLGDFGADIIKVERPGAGDDTRAWGPPYVTGKDGKPMPESAYYLAANRNKRSIAIDMASADGAALIRKLARHCDVVVENFKLGGLKKYGLDYESLSAEHPGLVYCSITGFGQTGPNAHRPGYDLLAQGYGGIMSLTGAPEGEPMKVGVGIADVVCGLYGGLGILAALRHRDQTGLGQQIDVSLVDTQVSWLVNEGTNYLLSGQEPKRRGNQHPNIVPYQVFQASDGHVIVAAGNDGQYQRFCKLLGLPELADDPRFVTNSMRLENRETLIDILSGKIATLHKQELVDGMEANNVPGGAINTIPEVFESEQVQARDMKISMPQPLAESGSVDLIGNPVKFSRTPVTYRHSPPQCGEQTDELLREILGEEVDQTTDSA
ncbi:MAG: CoA transferase [Alphaproteobacteria bacterium]|nr:CoA transferase [Alphaproteobacteria bacterium]